MSENEEWLKETGYKQRGLDGTYYFEYRNGDYKAYNTFNIHAVIEMSLKDLKHVHMWFMEKAERREEF